MFKLWQGSKGCPVTEVRSNGERNNGLFHLLINRVFLGDITHLITNL